MSTYSIFRMPILLEISWIISFFSNKNSVYYEHHSNYNFTNAEKYFKVWLPYFMI